MNKYNLNDWHLLADRFIWYDSKALSFIPKEVTDEQILEYLYTYHTDDISLEEIAKWRTGTIPDEEGATPKQSYDLWYNTSL